MDQINTLPDHILVEIFGNLSPNMIKCCTLVCKRWDEIVGNSLKLMGRFQLNFWRSMNKIQEVKVLKRKYQTALVYTLKDSLDVICRHKLQVLHIKCFEKTTFSTLVDGLHRFPSLKALEIDLDSTVDVTERDNFKKIQINLEELSCPIFMLRLFDCSTINKLVINLYPLDAKLKEIIIDFLKQQKNLEDLTLVGHDLNDFFTMQEILELKFALKKLTLFCETNTGFLHYDMLIRLLDRHKKTLTSLELVFCTDPSFGIKIIHTFVLENLTNLKYIRFGQIDSDNEEDIRENDFPFDKLPPATQVTKNLERFDVDFSATEEEFKRFFVMFPNLKHLTLNCNGENYALFPSSISEINVSLESLKLWKYGKSTDDQLNAVAYFPNLKVLIVDEFLDDDLCDFINQHSNTLEKIKFESCGCLKYQITKAILNCHNLKYLDIYFHNECVCAIGMFKEIAIRTMPFKLEIFYSSYTKSFIFPEDKAIWNEEIKILEQNIYKHCCPEQ